MALVSNQSMDDKTKGFLPAGWKWVRLGEVSTVISKGTTPTTLGHSFVPKGVPFLRAEDVVNGAVDPKGVAFHIATDTHEVLSRSKLRPGDLLITIAGTLGRVGFVPDDSPSLNCNQAVAFARLKPDLIDIHFAYLICRSNETMKPLLDLKAGGAIQNLNLEQVRNLLLPLPPLPEQKRIAEIVSEQMTAVEKARAAAEKQLEAAKSLSGAYIRSSFAKGKKRMSLSKALTEVTKGIGADWSKYKLLGATRAGIAPAKETFGKKPERYKPVIGGTIFYNPMRILLGSIAVVDEDEELGITSPDYVVLRTIEGILHFRWFYYWFRSTEGDNFIKTMTRGAVRERLLFKRLVKAEIELPSWQEQLKVVGKMKNLQKIQQQIIHEIDIINKLPYAILRRAFNSGL